LATISNAVSRVEEALTQQSIFMDGFFAKRYSLPLTAPVIAATPVGECCLILTRSAISDDSNNNTEDAKAERDYWRKWLDQVSRGNAVLVGANVATVNTGEIERNYKTAVPSSSVDWSNYP
jgi:phage gp36-like protein